MRDHRTLERKEHPGLPISQAMLARVQTRAHGNVCAREDCSDQSQCASNQGISGWCIKRAAAPLCPPRRRPRPSVPPPRRLAASLQANAARGSKLRCSLRKAAQPQTGAHATRSNHLLNISPRRSIPAKPSMQPNSDHMLASLAAPSSPLVCRVGCAETVCFRGLFWAPSC